MVRISSSIGVDLQDKTKEMLKDNKVLSFHFFQQVPKMQGGERTCGFYVHRFM